MKILAIIPARAGSVRLPNKNILPLNGKPLIQWTIDAALKSKCTDVIVSTDSQNIADISLKSGADVPFLRPSELSGNTATTIDVLKFTVDKLASDFDKIYDIIILLQPTSPLRSFKHIDEAIDQYIDKEVSSLASVCLCEHSPLWTGPISENNSMNQFVTNLVNKRSQDLPDFYRLNGAIYITNNENLKNNEILSSKSCSAYKMEQRYSIDIDNLLDFQIAETVNESINLN
jgi:CMP-N-acetylneuraminic acid synthetase